LKTKEFADTGKKDITISLINSPAVIINKTMNEVLVPDSGSVQVKKNSKSLNINFMINGSIVMITNWGSVRKDVKYISWKPNQASKNKIHRYSDYTQIPTSVSVTFKDNSTRVFTIK